MISEKMQQLVAGSSMIRAMFEEGQKLSAIYGAENVFDYSLGNPNVEPPQHIQESIQHILANYPANTIHGYMNNSGYEEVRAKIAQSLNQKHHCQLNQNNIVMSCGAAGGLNVVLKTILNPGDEVLTFAPFFGEYKNYVQNFDGQLIVAPTDTATFAPDFNKLESLINSKTKAVIINSPNNPTGVVYSEATIKNLCAILQRKEEQYGISIYLISDEPYREIAYDGIEVPYLINYYHNTFIGYSYSKSLSLPGERIGYLAINPQMDDVEDITAGLNVATRILGFVNAPSLFQLVIAECLEDAVDIKIYQKNRDVLYNHLISIGFNCVKPQGAFYLFPQSLIADDKKFCDAAKELNLLLVPGSGFGCPGHFRISYCVSLATIEKSLPVFTKLAAAYQ